MGRAEASRTAVSVLKHAADVLGRVPGRRKSIVYIGEGIEWNLTRGTFGNGLLDEIKDFLEAATRANARVYTIDPRGLAGHDGVMEIPRPLGLASDVEPMIRDLDADLSRSVDQLRSWASESGGVAAVSTSDLDASLERIATENRQYYLLGYSSPVTAPDGRFHRIEVRVKREGVSVRARRGYVSVARSSTSSSRPALEEAIMAPLGSRELRLETFAAPFRGATPGTCQVLVGVLLNGRDLNLEVPNDAGGPAIDFAIDARDASGRLAARPRKTVRMSVKKETGQAMRRLGLRFLDRLELAAGHYRLSVGAGDRAGGRVGAVSFEIDVPDLSAVPLAIGGLVLGSLRPPTPPGMSTGPWFRDWLDLAPTTARTFAQDDELSVFTELYAAGAGLSNPLRVSARLLDQRDTVQLEESSIVDAAAMVAAGGRHPYRARIPLSDLDPGRYRFRLRVESDAWPEGANREVAFTIGTAAY